MSAFCAGDEDDNKCRFSSSVPPTEDASAAIESNEKTRLKTNGLEGLAKANGNGKDQGDRKSDFYEEAVGDGK